MKKITFCVLCLVLVTIATHAQVPDMRPRIRPRITLIPQVEVLVNEQTIKLNGGARSFLGRGLGATSRIYIPVQLPHRTIEWYYSFTTSRNDGSNVESLQLSNQLTDFIAGSILTGPGGMFAGIAGSLLNSIRVPRGVLAINSYVLDEANAEAFMNRQPFTFIANTQMLNTAQGKLRIKTPVNFGQYYIGLQNISSMSAVVIKIEVAAIVMRQTNP